MLSNHKPGSLPWCSVYSPSAAVGLPRDSVRCKIPRLIEPGRVEKTGRDEVRLTPKVAEHFTPDFNVRPLERLLQTADDIRSVLFTDTDQTP